MNKPKLKRKRIKLECLECHAVFDNDYRKRHERTCHEGKRVRVAHKDAPPNPFQAAISRRPKQSDEKLENRQEDAEDQEQNKDVFLAKEREDGKLINGYVSVVSQLFTVIILSYV